MNTFIINASSGSYQDYNSAAIFAASSSEQAIKIVDHLNQLSAYYSRLQESVNLWYVERDARLVPRRSRQWVDKRNEDFKIFIKEQHSIPEGLEKIDDLLGTTIEWRPGYWPEHVSFSYQKLDIYDI